MDVLVTGWQDIEAAEAAALIPPPPDEEQQQRQQQERAAVSAKRVPYFRRQGTEQRSQDPTRAKPLMAIMWLRLNIERMYPPEAPAQAQDLALLLPPCLTDEHLRS